MTKDFLGSIGFHEIGPRASQEAPPDADLLEARRTVFALVNDLRERFQPATCFAAIAEANGLHLAEMVNRFGIDRKTATEVMDLSRDDFCDSLLARKGSEG